MFNLEGKVFGLWTVIKDSGLRTKNKQIIWQCKCQCGTIRNVKPRILKNESKPRSCGCSRKIRSKEIFESNYEKSKGCWEWKGCLNHGGYGKYGSKRLAHRISYENTYGPIPKGLQVCHTCDNRKCVNPAHLFLGTIGDNLKDMTDKGRRAKGSQIGTSILNENMVLEIRKMRLSGKKYQDISDYFGISWDLVGKICRNEQWQHVALGEECKKMPQIRKVAIGSKAGSAILNEEKVLEIRRSLSEGKNAKDIADEFGVTYWSICDIRQRRTWKHI